MVIILMFDDDNAQKSSTTMTLWSKYTPFKYYYLGPNQPGRGRRMRAKIARAKSARSTSWCFWTLSMFLFIFGLIEALKGPN